MGVKPGRDSEVIIYNGLRFIRRPKSKYPTHRDYYKSVTTKYGHLLLHREIWKTHNGEIPSGYVVHHIDENPLNNDISNLECISHSKHQSHHRKKYLDRNVDFWKSVQEKARVAMSELRRNRDIGLIKKRTKPCVVCKEMFEYCTSYAKTCSSRCRSKLWYHSK